MRNRIKLIAIILILVCVFPVCAVDSWELINGGGNWIVMGRNWWETEKDRYGAYLIYEFNSTNPFTKWISKVEETASSYDQPARFSHIVNFTLTNGTTAICFQIEWYIDTTFPIVQARSKTYTYVTNPDNYTELKWIAKNPEGNHFPIQFSFARIDNETLNLKFAVFPDTSYSTAIGTYEANYTLSDSFFNTAYVVQCIEKRINYYYGTNIKIGGRLRDEIFVCDGSFATGQEVSSMPLWQYIAWSLWNGITGEITYLGSKLRDLLPYLGWLYDALAFCLTFTVGIIQNVVSLSLPFLPIIVLFWFLDATLTSINEGNLQPIGNCFMTIYDFLRGIIQTIVSILNTIWSYLSGLTP